MKLSDKERARIILDHYFAGKLNPELDKIIQGWLLSDDNKKEKERALSSVFDQWFGYDPNPGRFAYESFAKARVRLGLPGRKNRQPFHKRLSFRVAAVLIPFLLVAGASAMLWVKADDGSRVRMAQTVVAGSEGMSREVVLADGSRVWVKGASTISYPEDFGRDRTVWLDGEAYFVVEKMDGKPFVVNTDNLKVKVLGTEFNVRDHGDLSTSEVVVASGRVEVTADGRKYVLTGLDRFTRSDNGSTLLERVAADKVPGKSAPRLVFENARTRDVLEGIARYKGVSVDIAPGLGLDTPITVDFYEDTSLETMLFVVQKAAGRTFGYEVVDGRARITRP